MAVRTRKPSKTICLRTHFTSSPPNVQARHRSAGRSTPHQLSNGDQDPESPIGTFAATARPARLVDKENRSPKTSSRTIVAPAKRQRTHLQRVQFQPRPADPVLPRSRKPSAGSSGDTVDISLFPTARLNALESTHDAAPAAPKFPVDETVDVGDEPGLLEVLSQSARSRSQSTARTYSNLSFSVEPRLELQIDYPASCYSVFQAKLVAKRLASSLIRDDPAGPSNWTNVSRDTIRQRHKAALHATRTTSVSDTQRQLVQYAARPPPAWSVCEDIGLAHPRSKARPAPEFSHGEPVSSQGEDQACPPHTFVHRPRYAGYSSNTETPRRFDVKHAFGSEPDTIANGPKQVVKVIIPFRGTPILSTDLVSSAELVRMAPAEDQAAQSCNVMEPIRLIWMQSTAQAFILALEQLLQAAEDQSQFDSILYYTTSQPSTASSECDYVTLYVHSDQLCQARALLASIDVAGPSGRPHRPITPFASTQVSLLVLSTAGHPLCLI